MKKIYKILVGAGLAAALAFGFGLPTVLGRLQDMKIESRTETLSRDLVKLTMKSTLNTGDRFHLVNHYSSSIILDSAQNMSRSEARDALKEGIEYLNRAFGSEKFTDYTIINSTVCLRMSEEESPESLVLWKFDLKDSDGNKAKILMDDQTGLILSATVRQSEEQEQLYSRYEGEKNADQYAEKIGEIMSEYLNCSLDTVYITEVSDKTIGYDILFQDENGILFAVPMSFGKGSFSFNS